MKIKLLSLTIGMSLLLTACGGQNLDDSKSAKSEKDDSVLWTNEDGSDCDFDDLLEGDKDCDTKVKTSKKKSSKYKKSTTKKIKKRK